MYRERQRLINENADSPGSSLGRESNASQVTATAEWLVNTFIKYPYLLICAIIHISLIVHQTIYDFLGLN